VEETATRAEENEENIGESEEIRETKSKEEIERVAEEILLARGNEEPKKEEKEKIIFQKVIIKEESLGQYTQNLFTYSVDTGFCICSINTDSIYYDKYVSLMDEEAKNAFKLLLASFVRTINEAAPEKRTTYKGLMNEWNYKLNKYLCTFLGIE